MKPKLVVVVNGAKILEYDRNQRLPGLQLRFLDDMDAKLDSGIRLGEERIESPDLLQRAQYVANTMINALFDEQDNVAGAMCTWLANRLPELQQVRAQGNEQDMAIELVFDRSYEESAMERPVQFFRN